MVENVPVDLNSKTVKFYTVFKEYKFKKKAVYSAKFMTFALLLFLLLIYLLLTT